MVRVQSRFLRHKRMSAIPVLIALILGINVVQFNVITGLNHFKRKRFLIFISRK